MSRTTRTWNKTILAAAVTLLATTPLAPAFGPKAAAESQPVALLVDSPYAQASGQKARLQARPFIEDGSTLVPVRFVSEQLGAKVEWIGDTRSIVVIQGGKEISLQIGSDEMTVNGKAISLPVSAEIKDDLTFVPLRAIGEALGQQVYYNDGLILLGSKAQIQDYMASAPMRNQLKDLLKPVELKAVMTGEPLDLNSLIADSTPAFTILNAIQEGLYRIGPDGKPVPALAKELPEVSSDGLTYTIRLRDNLYWQDGTRLTANDFVQTYRKVLETRSSYSYLLLWIQGGDVLNQAGPEEMDDAKQNLGVYALDDQTLQIRLTQPLVFFTSLLAFPTFFPVEERFVDAHASSYGTAPGEISGNGPFVLKAWNPGNEVVLYKNEHYWDAAHVQLDQIKVKIFRDDDTSKLLIDNGEADVVSFRSVPKEFPKLELKNELTNAYIEYQQSRFPAFSNAKIRLALGMAIDRQAFVDTVLTNGSIPSKGLVPTGTMDGNGNEFRLSAGDDQPSFDPKKARELLVEGLEELGLDKLPKFNLLGDDTTTAKKTLDYICNQWEKNLGIDAVPEPFPHGEKLERQDRKDFDASISLWGADYNDPMTFLDMFVSGGPYNNSDYENPRYDSLIRSAVWDKNPESRVQTMVQAEKLLMSDMPITPLYYRRHPYYIRDGVKGVQLSTFGPEWELRWATVSSGNSGT